MNAVIVRVECPIVKMIIAPRDCERLGGVVEGFKAMGDSACSAPSVGESIRPQQPDQIGITLNWVKREDLSRRSEKAPRYEVLRGLFSWFRFASAFCLRSCCCLLLALSFLPPLSPMRGAP